MLLPEDGENAVEEYDVVHHPNDTSADNVEGDLPLEKLLKLSKSFKTGIENNLSAFMKERKNMINEMSGISCTIIPNEEPSMEITEKQSLCKHEVGDSHVLFLSENSEQIRNLKQELLQNVQDSLNVLHNGNESKLQQEKIELSTSVVSSMQNKLSELHHMVNINQNIDEKTNYLKIILEEENKCQHWIDKYDELHGKYLRLESKYVDVEKENCNYQMEMTRIKIIEDENLRFNQTIDKSNRVCKELETALESCHKVISKYQTDMEVARNKVKEAVEVVEKTCSEKERLATNLKQSNEEIETLKNELKTLIQEAGKKVTVEIEKVKTMYKDKLHQTNVEMEFLRTENQIACNKIQQLERENCNLNQKYTSLNQKYMYELDIYSKKVASKVVEIEDYEVTLGNLISEIEILKGTNNKLQESYTRKKTKYTMEIEFLKDTAKSLEDNLNKAINEIAKNNKTFVETTNKIKTLELENIKLLQPENNLEQKNKQITELEEIHKQTINMWRTEMYDMIEGFKHKVNQLKRNCSQLSKNNVKLKRIINNSKIVSCKRKKISKIRKDKKPSISSSSTSA